MRKINNFLTSHTFQCHLFLHTVKVLPNASNAYFAGTVNLAAIHNILICLDGPCSGIIYDIEYPLCTKRQHLQ